LCSISENLNLKAASPLRDRYQDLFKWARHFNGMRNILAHRYGLPTPGVDWAVVWAVLDGELESDLLPKLDEAIRKEEEEEIDTDDEQE
jgi:uncharacterized protein with HEPN domain